MTKKIVRLPEDLASYEFKISYDISDDIVNIRDILLQYNKEKNDKEKIREHEEKLFNKLEEIFTQEKLGFKETNVVIPTLSFLITLALTEDIKMSTIRFIFRILRRLGLKGVISRGLVNLIIIAIGKKREIDQKIIKKYLSKIPNQA